MRRARLSGIIRTPVTILKQNGMRGVRTAGILLRQSPETLEAIRVAFENGIKQYPRANEFALPMAAHVIVVSKR